MSIEEILKITPEELHQAAAGNFNGLMFTTFEFLKQHQIPLLEYTHYIGKRFAETWTPGLTAYQLAEGMAVNMVSVGARLEELAGDETQSRLVVTGWPPLGAVEAFSGSLEEADQFAGLVKHIAENQNCVLELQRQDDHLVFLFTRKA